MSWFYIGQTENDVTTYRIVHQFDQLQEVGNPLQGQTRHIRVPQLTVDSETTDQEEARERVRQLNGGFTYVAASIESERSDLDDA